MAIRLQKHVLRIIHSRFLESLRFQSRSSKVRVRFAPSPTGHLHLGGLRTALYNYLYAKSLDGSFILRLEDTDQARLIPGASEKLNDTLLWVGLIPDEGPFNEGEYGPYTQSERLPIYKEYVQYLLDNGTAYRCFCTEKRLDLLRKDATRRGQVPKYDNRCRHLSAASLQSHMSSNDPYVVRFKLDDCVVNYQDLVFGSFVHNPGNSEGDFIIMKSDGYPTYHLANVVDDHLMNITHVLRGVEWQISTPKHLLLYKAFGWDPPSFAHLPLILNSDGTKLSKRHGDLHVEFFKSRGYFPEAVLNFIIQLGGGFGKCEGLSLRTLRDMTKEFSIDRVNVNSCRMDLLRLDDYNRMAIQRRLDSSSERGSLTTALRQMIENTLEAEKCPVSTSHLTEEYVERVLDAFKDRIGCLHHLLSQEYLFIWVDPGKQLAQLLNASVPSRPVSDILPEIVEKINSIPTESFTKDAILPVLRSCSANKPIKFASLMKLIRLALSGQADGLAVVEMMELLGKDVSVRRLTMVQELLRNSEFSKSL